MKLSNKEKIVLTVFLVIVVIAVGLFLIIMPEYNKISTYKSNLDSVQTQRDQIYQSLSRESTIDQELQEAINNANTFSASFYDDMTTYEADVIVREILEATNMSTKSLSIGNYSTATLTVSDYIETVVSYPLKEYSGSSTDSETPDIDVEFEYDENGLPIGVTDESLEGLSDYLKDTIKDIYTAVLSTQQQTIGAITVSFTVEGTRGDFLKFLDYVSELENATHINSTSIAYTESSASASDSEEGTETAVTATTIKDSTKISAPVSITFYCVAPLTIEEETATAGTEAAE